LLLTTFNGHILFIDVNFKILIVNSKFIKARDKSNKALQNFIFRIVKKSTAFINHKDCEKIINAIRNLK
jgi:hypothetical protein